MPVEYVAESLLPPLRNTISPANGFCCLARVARDPAPAELFKGCSRDVVEAYRTVIPLNMGARPQVFFGERKPDWITFTSSSTVTNFVHIAGSPTLEGVKVASIGPVTSATAGKYGIAVTVEASRYTIEGLIEAMVEASGDLINQ
jgi:uroporphyrinogen III methyltransferase/synthase